MQEQFIHRSMPTAYNLRLMNSSISACCPSCVEMNSINHIALRYPNSAMSGMHTNRTMPTLAPASTPSAKAGMDHLSLAWIPAKMGDPWNRALESLKIHLELSLTGFSLM
eukprot:scaffold225160_cov27-Tisochrysis_lutea.AAC.1